MEKNHQTTSRVLDILELLSNNNFQGLRFSEISRALNMPKSSLHPLLQTLADRKYVRFSENTQKYYFGEMLFHLGHAYVENSSLLEQIMTRLVNRCGVSSFFGVLSGSKVLYLLAKSAPGNIHIVATPGRKVYANGTGVGKSLLSGYTRQELEQLFPEGLPSITEKTITDMDVLYAQLEAVRRTGFSYEREESSAYTRCIATPITYHGRIIASMSASFLDVERSREELDAIQESLKTAREETEKVICNNISSWIYSEI